VILGIGAVILVVFGVTLGLGVARFTQPDRTTIPPGSRIPVPIEPPQTSATDRPGPIPPEMLRGMLQAAHQSLDTGRYREAIAAYQAVLKRDPRNVEAITHLGVVLSVAGHTEDALGAFDKAISIDPRYAHAYWDKARVLYEAKRDYEGAIRTWEQFVSLVSSGEDRDRALNLMREAQRRLTDSKR
ncbi:MAG: tetratricopeptide repeat protein, partial [Anaerolineae bacterium]